MNTLATNDRVFSELDVARIQRLTPATAPRGDALPPVFDALDEGNHLPPRPIPPNVVTMNSRVVIVDDSAVPRSVTLCYPEEADTSKARYSVLSPIGGALLGHQVGDVVTLETPGGKAVKLRIKRIEYQPEAAGNYLR